MKSGDIVTMPSGMGGSFTVVLTHRCDALDGTGESIWYGRILNKGWNKLGWCEKEKNIKTIKEVSK